MACDPNTLIEQAKCLNACIPQGMMPAVNTSLLCQILEAGGGGGGEFVLKTGDSMTGALSIDSVSGSGLTIANSSNPDAKVILSSSSFTVFDEGGGGSFILRVDYSGALGFFTTAPQGQQASGSNLTNNVTVGGVNDTIADFTNLTVYATDAAAIRNDIYQLARKLKQINDGLRAYGLFT